MYKFENMNAKYNLLLVLTVLACLLGAETFAQFGNPMGMQGNRFGRQRSQIPAAHETPPEPEKLSAEELVEKQMPEISETVGLDPFEQAVVKTILTNAVQKKMELQILRLEPQKKCVRNMKRFIKNKKRN